MHHTLTPLLLALAGVSLSLTPPPAGGQTPAASRLTLSLDGTWQVEEGTLDRIPAQFSHTVPVPGLVDMAAPAFESPGSAVSLDKRRKWQRPADPRREAFWYRRTFKLDGALPAVAKLKIDKARYGTRVFLNGQPLGEHGPNFTPGWFDARPFLRAGGAENELVIRVGASLAQVPPHLTEGWDFEKSRYLPGIYDSVRLILCGTPHVVNVQAVPDVAGKSVRAVVELAGTASGPVKAVVREVTSGRVAGEVAAIDLLCPGKLELTVALAEARLWTPEDPFLYELTVETGGDTFRNRFGLRSFGTDPKSGRALLNGKPYYLRGSNVCIYRFFEDAERGGLPWDREWVRNLHRRFKEMHWNSLRYCIGFPPELWYEIADEEGILIQDEFPIWYGGGKTAWPKAITPQHLAVEYTEWMRERWNHPCVVIWDAQNETTDDAVIASAIGAVRSLDLSRRPWDNGWGTPQQAGDISEAHPYRANRNGFFANFANETGIPDNGPRQGAKPPYLINEYGWLWINRDGTLPTLTVDVYKRLLGENATAAERFEYYARTLAAKTEFWRSKRTCAGVLHFCGLGYSRHDGQTSDHFIDVKNLTYEPNFRRYVGDAFAPVGIMLDFWAGELPAGAKQQLAVMVINDVDGEWAGSVRLRLLQGNQTLHQQDQPCRVPPLGDARLAFEVPGPAAPGSYRLEAALVREGSPEVRSLRDFRILSAEEIEARRNLAEGRPVTASSVLTKDGQTYSAAFAVDGRSDTRWSSEFSEPQWLAVDLGAARTVSRVELAWEGAFAKSYAIEVSTDGEQWVPVHQTTSGTGKVETVRFPPAQARWVRISITERGTRFGCSLWEMGVYR